jgi:hypothetical protein
VKHAILPVLLAAANCAAATVYVDDFSVAGYNNSGTIAISSTLNRTMWTQTNATFGIYVNFAAAASAGTTGNFTVQYEPRSPYNSFSLIPSGGDTAATTNLVMMISSNQATTLTNRFFDSNEMNATWTVNVTTGLHIYSIGLSQISSTLDWSSITTGEIKFHLDAGGNLGFPGEASWSAVGTYAPPVPEPSTYGLALGGLALVGAAIRRRRK